MLIVMIAIGTTDLIFALDSIPAIFGLTQEPYLVFTANVFALMGLRQLYFLLGGLLDRLIYLSYGLAVVLGFIGVKLVLEALPTTTCRSSTAASTSAGRRTSRSGCRWWSSSAPWPSPPWPAWSSPPGTGAASWPTPDADRVAGRAAGERARPVRPGARPPAWRPGRPAVAPR